MKLTAVVTGVQQSARCSWSGLDLYNVTAESERPKAEITVSLCESRARAYRPGRRISVEIKP